MIKNAPFQAAFSAIKSFWWSLSITETAASNIIFWSFYVRFSIPDFLIIIFMHIFQMWVGPFGKDRVLNATLPNYSHDRDQISENLNVFGIVEKKTMRQKIPDS